MKRKERGGDHLFCSLGCSSFTFTYNIISNILQINPFYDVVLRNYVSLLVLPVKEFAKIHVMENILVSLRFGERLELLSVTELWPAWHAPSPQKSSNYNSNDSEKRSINSFHLNYHTVGKKNENY